MQSKHTDYNTGLPLAGYSIYIYGNANKMREHFFLFLGTADWADFTCSSIQQHDSWPAVGAAATVPPSGAAEPATKPVNGFKQ